MRRRHATAIHESGHAIALLAQRLPFEKATIRPGSDFLGRVTHATPLMFEPRERRQVARGMILCCYAGFEAEQIAYPHADAGFASQDYENAFDLSREYGVLPRSCAMIGDDAHDAYLERLKGEARRLMRTHWLAVDAFAGLLLKKTTVTYDAAKQFWNAR
jgi:hypothetical protein